MTIRAVEQEKEGTVYHLRGSAEIDYRDYILRADTITYNSETSDSELEGHVVLDGGPYDEHVEAANGTYNIRTQVGKFYSVVGTAGLRGKTFALCAEFVQPVCVYRKDCREKRP